MPCMIGTFRALPQKLWTGVQAPRGGLVRAGQAYTPPMAFHRRIDREPIGTTGGTEELRPTRSSTELATATMACPECDAPVMPAGRVQPRRSDRLPVLRHRRRRARLPLARGPGPPRPRRRAGRRAMSWLPDDFEHPLREDLPTGHHLRPIRGADVDIDMPGGDGLARAAVGEVRRGLGLAGRDDHLRGRPRGPRAPRRGDRAPRDLQLRGPRTRTSRPCSAASTSTRPTTARPRAPTPSPPGGSSTPRPAADLERALDDFVPRWLAETLGLRSVDFSP